MHWCRMKSDAEDEAGQPLKIVDAHAHFWNLEKNHYPWLSGPHLIPFRYGDYSALRRSYLPDDYRREARDVRLAGLVHIEAEYDPADPVGETRWLEEISRECGLPSACVCQARLDRDDVEEVLSTQSAFPLVRGVRHKPAAADDPRDARRGKPGSMDCPHWRRGYELLFRFAMSFDLQTPFWHLDAAAELAADFPETQIIINHAGLPADRSAEGLRAWRKALDRVADHDNVALKISGLGLRGRPWTVTDNRPVVRDAIAIFGVDRSAFASNFPVDSLVADYETIFSGFREITKDFMAEETSRLFCDNAIRLYRLNSEPGETENDG